MKATTRSLIAGLFVAAAAAPALASDEGLPPQVAAGFAAATIAAPQTAERFVPQYLVGQGGEETLVVNPAFVANVTERTPSAVIMTGSAPATRYVGA